MLLFLLIVAAFVAWVATPEERRDAARIAVDAIRHAIHRSLGYAATRGFSRAELRANTPWLALALAAAAVVIFIGAVFENGALDDPGTLVAWGASFGPRAANGEWWRLVSATFVHASIVALLINVVAIVQIGLVIERRAGSAVFGAAYACAAFFSGLMHLAEAPDRVSAGASGAVFGLYGLLLAVFIRGLLRPSPQSIPLKVMARLAPPAAVFVLYNLAVAGFDLPSKAGLFTGFTLGIVVTRGFGATAPSIRRLACTTAAAFGIAVVASVPLRGMTDIKPELELLVAMEQRTAAAYEAAVARFRAGHVKTASLVAIIDRTILPEIQTMRARWAALARVPASHEPMRAAANEFLALREQSWRQRIAALRKGNMRMLRDADRTEHAALAAFDPIVQHLSAPLSTS